MCITLNQKAEFDLETLDFIKENPKSFNYIKSEGTIVPLEHRYYQVLHDRKLVGFIIISDENTRLRHSKNYELNIGTFNDYQNQKYGEKALNKLFDLLKNENIPITLSAKVKSENEYQKAICKLLEKTNFELDIFSDKNIDIIYNKDINI